MSEVKVDTISERTAANGVAIDGVTIKDSGLTIPSGGEIDIASGGTLDVNGTLDVTGATVSGLSAGKVLQYQSKQGYTGHITVDNNTTYTSCGTTWNISITPNATTSKIIVKWGSIVRAYGVGAYMGRLKVYRQINGGGYSDIDGEAASVAQTLITQNNANLQPFNTFYVDTTHNTTSQVDYQIYMSSSNNVQVEFADSTGSYRYISAMEVGA